MIGADDPYSINLVNPPFPRFLFHATVAELLIVFASVPNNMFYCTGPALPFFVIFY
jgi:hypothetical protein